MMVKLDFDKSLVDEAVRRVLEMRINRGIKTKVFHKVKPLRKSSYRDDNDILKRHQVKRAS